MKYPRNPVSASLFLLAISFGCVAASRDFERNPDRDLSGLAKVPLLPASMDLLRRTAEVRTDWKVPVSAKVAEKRVLEGARNCWNGERTTADWHGGAAAELTRSRTGRIVDVDRWPDLSAVAVGLGADTRSNVIGVNRRGYSVMFAIVELGPDTAAVFAYRRLDNSVQRRLVAAAQRWLSGETDSCDDK